MKASFTSIQLNSNKVYFNNLLSISGDVRALSVGDGVAALQRKSVACVKAVRVSIAMSRESVFLNRENLV